MKKFVLLLMFFLLFPSISRAQFGAGEWNIKEEDGSPSGKIRTNNTLKVTNGTLTHNADGTWSLSLTGGGSASLPTILAGNFVYAATTGTVYTNSGTVTYINNTFSAGSPTFVVNNTTGNVGIGTSTPNSKLTVSGNSSFTGNTFVSGTVTANSFVGDGSGITGLALGGGISGTITSSSPGNLAHYSTTNTIILGSNTLNLSSNLLTITGNETVSGLGTFGSVNVLGTGTFTNIVLPTTAIGTTNGNISVYNNNAYVYTGSNSVSFANNAMVVFNYDGNGSAVTTTSPSIDFVSPFNGEIVGVDLRADVVGCATITFSKASYTNYPITFTTLGTATISMDSKTSDTTLSGWTTAITKGDTVRANLDGTSTVKFVNANLEIRKK